jgi:predicted DNA-binding transcriptional regulator YafY
VPRNQEVIRQWRLLHALDASRHGASIDALADELEVTTRTIRRDLAALQEAGFPLYDERDDDGRVRWRMDGHVLNGLETGFTLAELCAMYLSRNLLESVAGTPFQRDLTNAFGRLEKMLSPRMRQFLDRLPSVLAAKPGPRARQLAWGEHRPGSTRGDRVRRADRSVRARTRLAFLSAGSRAARRFAPAGHGRLS